MALSVISRNLSHQLRNHFKIICRSFAVQKMDILQEAALDQEYCILVDGNDNTLGSASKRACHVVGSDGGIPLHRAFSVFLFNSKGDMLLQRRGDKKVTFPNVYANACCSHPLWIGNEEEDIFVAARRRINYELGIPLNQIDLKDINYLTRIHYHHTGDGKWGEHEIDYIFFIQKDVDLAPNPEEIMEVRYIPKENFNEAVTKLEAPISPWFQLIMKHRLKFWWDNLHQLRHCQDHKTIHKLA